VTPAERVASLLKDIVGDALIQVTPYPVVAPRKLEVVPRILSIARAESFRVMFLGNGTTFSSDFSLLRDNVIAVTTIVMSGIEKLTPFAVRVLAGTPVSHILKSEIDFGQRTVGGLIASSPSQTKMQIPRVLVTRMRALEVLTAKGEFRHFNFPSLAHPDDPGIANCFLGSKGRLAMIAAIHLVPPLPFYDRDHDPRISTQHGMLETRPALAQEEVESLLDPEGVFKW
jgi:hypothetical protein